MGKTSISAKYVNDEFHDQTDRTINASYLEKKLKLDSGQQAKMSIWVPLPSCRTLLGQEEYNSLAPIYYKDAAGAVIVYDITSVESFAKVKKWVAEL